VAPNPSVGGDIRFEITAESVQGDEFTPRLGTIRLEIFDLTGRLVRKLTPPGGAEVVRVRWDGRDQAGRRVASGRYWVRTPKPVYPPEYLTESFLLLK